MKKFILLALATMAMSCEPTTINCDCDLGTHTEELPDTPDAELKCLEFGGTLKQC